MGNLRAALLAHADCRKRGGIFILRIEDIDVPRTVAGSEGRIIEDLRWLGLDWDEGPDIGGPAGPYRQSERGEIYAAALEALNRAGRTYLCTCSRKDLREASAPHEGEESPYPGTCRTRDPKSQRNHPAGAATRFIVRPQSSPNILSNTASIQFDDMLRGPQAFDLEKLGGDFIIRRRDGLWAYQLACAVDDALMGVTHVIRGADLLSSAARQIAILRALGLPEPRYGHHPLMLDTEGRKLSKRDGSNSLRQLREAGLTPERAREIILRESLAES